MHFHLLGFLSPKSSSNRCRQQCLSGLTVPFAFHPETETLAWGLPSSRMPYTCSKQECAEQIRKLVALSPHQCVVEEMMQAFLPDSNCSQFCAGYMTLGPTHIWTNEHSGHFGQNWNAEAIA